MLRWFTVFILCCALPWSAMAATEIEISSPGEQSIPLALTTFLQSKGEQSALVAGVLNEVLVADLDRLALAKSEKAPHAGNKLAHIVVGEGVR